MNCLHHCSSSGAQTASSLFRQLHQRLTSGVELSDFLSVGEWDAKLYPDGNRENSASEVVASTSEDFSVQQLAALKAKGDANDPAPTLLAVTMWSTDEQRYSYCKRMRRKGEV